MTEQMIANLKAQREKTDALIGILNLYMPEFDSVYEGLAARNLRRVLMQRLEYVEDYLLINKRLDK